MPPAVARLIRALAAAAAVVCAIGACSSSVDCQNNGDCVANACVCDPGWSGTQCSALKEGRSWVLWPEASAQPITAGWGATIVHGSDGLFHMYATVVNQMAQNGTYMTCYHTQATQIVHATASAAQGPYELAGVAIGPEANCPHAVRTASGELLLFHNNDDALSPLPLLTCTGAGAGGGCEQRPPSTTLCGAPGVGTVAVARAPGPGGPWTVSYPLCDIGAEFNTISNPSAFIAANGSVLLALRYFAAPSAIVAGANVHLPGRRSEGATATPGAGNATREALVVLAADSFEGPYRVLNGDVTPMSSEDPFLYANKRGFHMLAHQFNASCGCPYGDPAMVPGLHLFSAGEGAAEWVTSPLPPYTNALLWANGTRSVMNYRERPELLLDEDGSPAFLITGTEWGHKYKYPAAGGPCQSVAIITEILP